MSLEIKNLSVSVNDKIILNDFNFNINDSEVVAIMGPNGVGKSTLSRVIMNDPSYKVISGEIIYNGEVINDLNVTERARKGIFLAMQSPMEIDGVSNQDFLQTAINAREGKRIGLYDFIKKVETATEELKMDKSLIHRNLNIGFSGGEKKKNEVLQIKLLKPSLIMLDELDSGLDVDSLKIVAENIKQYKKENPSVSILIITHYQDMLKLIQPDRVCVLNNGKIVKTGDYNLALDIFNNGYNKYVDKTNAIAVGEDNE